MDGWDAATAEIITWFLQQSPPPAPFVLDPARTVVDPPLFFRRLLESILSGPKACGADVMREDLRLVWSWWQTQKEQ